MIALEINLNKLEISATGRSGNRTMFQSTHRTNMLFSSGIIHVFGLTAFGIKEGLAPQITELCR